MTIHRDVARGCKRKVRFVERRAAEMRASRHSQVVYECQWCGGYHCTSQSTSMRIERERAERALAELHRKGVVGPLLDAAIANVATHWAKRDGK